MNKEIIQFLEYEGIQIQYTAGYSPEQNGVAERKNRYLIEMVRCMLADAKLPKALWGEAVSTANYLQNRIVTRTTGVTPYEKVLHKVPDLSHLRIFGKIEGVSNHSSAPDSYNEIILNRGSDKDELHDNDKAEEDNNDESRYTLDFDDNLSLSSESDTSIKSSQNDVERVRRSQRQTKGKVPARYLNLMKGDIPINYKEAAMCNEHKGWLEAMKKEIDSMNMNNTWTLVNRPKDQNVIGCRWVFKKRLDGENVYYKARLVARGFSQQYGIDYNEVFAPVVSHTTLRTLFALSGKRNLKIHHIDCKTAFLNSTLNEEIFMEQPEGFIVNGKEDKVCLLKKSVYGLKQSARSWNRTIHNVLIQSNFQQSISDPCLYSCSEGVELTFVLIYVDDILIASKEETTIAKIKEIFKRSFGIHDLGPITNYLGLEVCCSTDGFYSISQTEYIHKILKENGLQDSKPSSIPLEVSYGKSSIEQNMLNNNKNYQKLIGSLLYIALNTRPDISAAINILSQKIKNPNEEDWNELKRVARYLKGTADMKLHIVPNNNEVLVGYSDANWGEDRLNRKSNSGYIFKVYGAVVSWACRKQTCVALSSTEAEFIALAEASKEALWLKELLLNFGEKIHGPIVINEDNQSCIRIIEGFKLNNRTKHIDVKYHFVKDYVAKDVIKCKYCPTNEMHADLLTKPLTPYRIKYLRSELKISNNLE